MSCSALARSIKGSQVCGRAEARYGGDSRRDSRRAVDDVLEGGADETPRFKVECEGHGGVPMRRGEQRWKSPPETYGEPVESSQRPSSVTRALNP